MYDRSSKTGADMDIAEDFSIAYTCPLAVDKFIKKAHLLLEEMQVENTTEPDGGGCSAHSLG